MRSDILMTDKDISTHVYYDYVDVIKRSLVSVAWKPVSDARVTGRIKMAEHCVSFISL